MNKKVDLYDSTYSGFREEVLAKVRKETFGADIGQNSWITAPEFDRFISWLNLTPAMQVLEIASGSGGPAGYLAGKANCHVTGIDANESGIAEAIQNAVKTKQTHLQSFINADADKKLPFKDNFFDALICMDSMNHFRRRENVFKEWHRVLRPGRRAVFTDPVVITGPVTNEELAIRSSIGLFLYVPQGVNEQFIETTGFKLIQTEDVTENAALVSGKWFSSRGKYREELIRIEGEERYEGLQKFFAAVQSLSSEKRLSRIAYLVEK
jgi:SAM-dependent methyltransferase